MSAEYTLHLLDDDYNVIYTLQEWQSLHCELVLDGISTLTMNQRVNSPVLPYLSWCRKINIYRNEALLLGVELQMDQAKQVETASGSSYHVEGSDLALYAKHRGIVPDEWEDYDEHEDHVDNVAKALVRRNMGTLAASARRITNLTVDQDKSQVESAELKWERGRYVLPELQTLSTNYHFHWRFVPSAAGWLFETRYPLWGVDRSYSGSVANGGNALIWSQDLGNILQLDHTRDLREHDNVLLMQGQGKGATQVGATVEDIASRAAYRRRERWVSLQALAFEDELIAAGQVELEKYAPSETITVLPKSDTFMSQWGLGDKVTLREQMYHRDESVDCEILGVDIAVDKSGIATEVPKLKKAA